METRISARRNRHLEQAFQELGYQNNQSLYNQVVGTHASLFNIELTSCLSFHHGHDIKARSIFGDVDMWLLFDVLMDGEYRPTWDTHMIESFTLGYLNPNNDIGYYASKFLYIHYAH